MESVRKWTCRWMKSTRWAFWWVESTKKWVCRWVESVSVWSVVRKGTLDLHEGEKMAVEEKISHLLGK